MTRRLILAPLLRAVIPAVAGMLAVASFSSPGLSAQATPRERTVYVSAVDDKGEPVEGLGPSDFIIREDGQRREVLRVSRAIDPIDIALLLDTSAAAANAVSSIRDAVRGFVATMAPANQIAIIGLADRPTVLVDYTSDPKRLEDGVGRLFSQSTSGMTLLDALVETSTGLRKRDTPRAVIVPVITDGTEFTNRYYRDVIAAMTQAGAALHAVTIGTFYTDTNSNEERERAFVLDVGTKDTGGQRITVLTDSAVVPALSKLARELSSQYKVVYGRPESLIPSNKTDVSSGRRGVTMRGTPARGQTGA
jgi:Ca-activated chloride channel homolog